MTGWQRFARAFPISLGLTMVAAVWLSGATWSFAEQTRFARSRGFDFPQLLPITLDGLALSLAARRAARPPARKQPATRQGARPAADPLAVAREIAQALGGQGQRVSRRTLQREFRDRGHSLSTDKAAELLAQLEAA